MFAMEVTGDAANAITLSGVIVTLGGVIAWVLKSALPSLLQAFREDTATMRHEFREELALFRADLKEIAASGSAMNARLSESMDKLADEISALKSSHENMRV